jgi:hypothetical protein
VEGTGVAAGEATVADHGVGGHADEPGGGPHTVTVGQMLKDREGLLRGQLRAEQRRALAFGEPIPAGAAVQEPDVPVLAVTGADRQVAEATLAVVGTVVVLAAETGNVVVHGSASLTQQKQEPHRKSIGTQWLT